MSRSEASEANTTPAEEIQCSCGDVHWGGSNVVVVSNINSLPLFFFFDFAPQVPAGSTSFSVSLLEVQRAQGLKLSTLLEELVSWTTGALLPSFLIL